MADGMLRHRSAQLFDILVEFPESSPALLDLRVSPSHECAASLHCSRVLTLHRNALSKQVARPKSGVHFLARELRLPAPQI